MNIASIFQDHMMLQHGKPVPVWGTGKDGEQIKVSVMGRTEYTVVSDGCWCVILPPLEPCPETTICIAGERDRIELQDVAIGEIWLAAGQSNMEFYMFFDEDYDREKEDCKDELLRFFDLPKLCYKEHAEDFDYQEMGVWRTCNSENLKYYSAVAYYAAKELRREMDIPVGIVGCNWGGTSLSCWMSEEALQKHGMPWLTEYQEALAEIPDMDQYFAKFRTNPINGKGRPFDDPFNLIMMRHVPREQQLAMMQEIPDKGDAFRLGPCSPNRPSGLYEYMVSAIAPFGIRGIFWYQGESDTLHPELYRDLFSDLVDCWRALWKEELPFITAQLAPFEAWLVDTGEQFPRIRQAQEKAALEMNRVYLISTSDAGMRFDIHPKKKQPVGERMAFSALRHIYGREDILGDAPLAAEAILDNGLLQIRFHNAGRGLYLEEGDLPIILHGSDGESIIRDVHVEGDSLYGTVDDETVTEVLFAQTPYYKVNLYNSAHIPALPFRLLVKS